MKEQGTEERRPASRPHAVQDATPSSAGGSRTSNGDAAEPRTTNASPVGPDELARRELVAWCERHGLPVPLERRDP